MSYCCICKSHTGSHADITFHTIPRSEEFRAKWIAVIGKHISNYNKVCSDHFKPNDFLYKTNKLDQIQRYLIKGAIPTAEKCQNLHDTKVLKLPNEKSESFCESQSDSYQLEKNSNNENSVLQHAEVIEDVLSPVLQNNMDNNQNNSMSTRKRKQSVNKTASCNKIRTVKFIGDLCPEDFTSPECYEVVKKYLKKHTTRINSLQKQVSRLTEKVNCFKDLLSQLHKKSLLSSNAVDTLKIS